MHAESTQLGGTPFQDTTNTCGPAAPHYKSIITAMQIEKLKLRNTDKQPPKHPQTPFAVTDFLSIQIPEEHGCSDKEN